MLFNKKEDSELTMFQTMLKMGGLWFVDVSRRRKTVQVGCALGLTLSNIVAQLSFLKSDLKDLYLDVSVGTIMLDLIYLNIEIFIYLSNVDTMNHFIVTMKAILKKRKQEWEVEIFDRFSSRAWKLGKFSFSTVSSFWLFVVIAPALYDLYSAVFTDSPEPFIVVNYYVKYLPLVKEMDLLYCATVFGTIFITSSAGLYFFNFICILPTTVAYMCAELRIIGRKLELWSADKENPDRLLVLKEIINDHNEILRLIEKMRKYLGLLLLPQSIFSAFSITLCLFSISQALKSMDIDIVLRMLYITSGMTSLLFINCYCAQDLLDENVRLSNVLRMIPWYEESPQVRRSLLMTMMVVSHKPLSIDCKGVVNINLRVFGEMIQTSYSLFTILQSTV